jgi:predicted alpha/beta-hydrolase family hydrolase
MATLLYQFLYLERRSRRPDSPTVAQATVRTTMAMAAHVVPELPLIAGGKSYGGRMTSQAQAASPVPGVVGLVFAGFPLHPAGKPSDERAKHLDDVDIPMLFPQGTRDKLADPTLPRQLVDRLGDRATPRSFDDADHSFHVPKRSGRTDAEVLYELTNESADWIDGTTGG